LVHSEKIKFLSVIFSLTSTMSKLSMDNVASISHDMYVHRTMFTKPVISHNHNHSVNKDKGGKSIYTYVSSLWY
jgi:hypothetical protein